MKTLFGGTVRVNLAVAFLIATAVFSSVSFAEAKTTAAVPEKDLHTVLAELKSLYTLLEQRVQFIATSAVSNAERQEYFSFMLGEDSTTLLVGKVPGTISINTDAGVSQILLVSECAELEGVLALGGNQTCMEKTWVSSSTEIDGIRHFSVPIQYTTKDPEAELQFTAYACRYNGCLYEQDFSIQYKTTRAFSDALKIYDRYEWTYEWNDRIYHVQEVLLNFPYENVRKVKLLVRCDVSGLGISTDEDNRATCNNRREYSQPDYKKYTTDEQGNTFNLKIESVTRNIQKENVGAVAMTFTFIGKGNNVLYEVTYRPVQLDVEEEEEEDEEEAED